MRIKMRQFMVKYLNFVISSIFLNIFDCVQTNTSILINPIRCWYTYTAIWGFNAISCPLEVAFQRIKLDKCKKKKTKNIFIERRTLDNIYYITRFI